MAAGAAIVLTPHAIWLVTERGGASYDFVRTNVMAAESFGAALGGSAYYLLGVAAYAVGPLLLLAALRPNRVALADIVWPADDDRQQAVLLFAVPLVLPALLNLVLPYRLTPDWTFPNWPLLPIVLYASLALVISTTAVAAAGLIALALTLAALVAAPFIAYQKLRAGADPNRPSSHHVVEAGRAAYGPAAAAVLGFARTDGRPAVLSAKRAAAGGEPAVACGPRRYRRKRVACRLLHG